MTWKKIISVSLCSLAFATNSLFVSAPTTAQAESVACTDGGNRYGSHLCWESELTKPEAERLLLVIKNKGGIVGDFSGNKPLFASGPYDDRLFYINAKKTVESGGFQGVQRCSLKISLDFSPTKDVDLRGEKLYETDLELGLDSSAFFNDPCKSEAFGTGKSTTADLNKKSLILGKKLELSGIFDRFFNTSGRQEEESKIKSEIVRYAKSLPTITVSTTGPAMKSVFQTLAGLGLSESVSQTDGKIVASFSNTSPAKPVFPSDLSLVFSESASGGPVTISTECDGENCGPMEFRNRTVELSRELLVGEKVDTRLFTFSYLDNLAFQKNK